MTCQCLHRHEKLILPLSVNRVCGRISQNHAWFLGGLHKQSTRWSTAPCQRQVLRVFVLMFYECLLYRWIRKTIDLIKKITLIWPAKDKSSLLASSSISYWLIFFGHAYLFQIFFVLVKSNLKLPYVLYVNCIVGYFWSDVLPVISCDISHREKGRHLPPVG